MGPLHWSRLETFWQDIQYSVRTLRKSPGFVITAVLILSIGIGLNLAFFQFINVFFLKPLAVQDAASLVHVTVPAGEDRLDYAAMQFLRSSNTVFSAVLLDMRVDAPSRANGWRGAAPERRLAWDGTTSVGAHFVSPNWFDELGVRALHGRLFSESIDGGPDAAPVAVVSERFWENHLQKDPGVVGSTVRLTAGGGPITIIGIVPRAPGGLLPAGNNMGYQLNGPAVWVPVAQIPYLFPGIRRSSVVRQVSGSRALLSASGHSPVASGLFRC